MPNSTSGLIVFVKAPQAGKVKTRLGKTIGMEQSCEVYRNFGNDWIARLAKIEIPLLIFYAPSGAEQTIQSWLGDEYQYFAQHGKDLGDRMTHAFETGFGLGFRELMIFGSDSPDLPIEIIHEGISAIQKDQIVIGPSNDGGYYTLGMRQEQWFPELFHDIQWSTEQVYPKTIEILKQHQKAVHPLPQWDDVDTLTDLQAFYGRICKNEEMPRTLEYLNTHLIDQIKS